MLGKQSLTKPPLETPETILKIRRAFIHAFSAVEVAVGKAQKRDEQKVELADWWLLDAWAKVETSRRSQWSES